MLDNYIVDSGGVKFDQNKPRPDLIPPLPFMELCMLYAKGANKYQDRNWERGMRFGRMFGAMIRHAFLWWAGEEKDKETNSHHLIAVAFNALGLRELEITHKEFDDRPENPNDYIDLIYALYGDDNDKN